MDQAASIFSRRDFLLFTTFFPKFNVQHVPVPPSFPEMTFMVAQSFIASNKAVTAPRCYNLRVAECTLAAVVLAKLNSVELPKDSTALGYSLRNFHEEYMRKQGHLQDPMEYQLETLAHITYEQLTQEEGYTREEIASILEIDVPALEQRFLSSFPVEAERFFLRQRASHCFWEAHRVYTFRACLAHASVIDHTRINWLGRLINDSQASCRDLYDNSCPEVNSICDIARKSGAIGSRLTGAGWGGGTVHFIGVEQIDKVKEALKHEYYLKRFPDITEEQLQDAMVVSKPSNGAFL